MYFSRVQLKTDIANSEKMANLISKNGYFTHQFLWELFPHDPDAERDFIYRQEYKKGESIYYLVSRRKPLVENKLAYVDIKEYFPIIRKGEYFEFSLRVNPVVTRKIPGTEKQIRHDVVMDAKYKLRESGKPKSLLPTIVAEEGSKWLFFRASQRGFIVDPEHLIADGYHQHCFLKKNSRREIKFSTIDFQGRLTVIEPDVFIEALYTGIGRSKAFGCGLMLVRRI